VQARVLVLEFRKDDIDKKRLTACQGRRDEGVCATVMATFLAWIAPRYEAAKAELQERAREYRQRASASDRHRRTAALVGNLQAGFDLFLDMVGARDLLDSEKIERLRGRCWAALMEAAAEQQEHQASANPVNAFLRLLRSALASGSAHVANADGGEPAPAGALGWRAGEDGRCRAMGARVGWVDGDDLYLDPDAALKAAQSMSSDTDRIEVTTTSLGKRLKEAGLLASTDSARGRVLVRRTIQGARAAVLHLGLGVFTGAAQPAQPAQGGPGDAWEADNGPDPWAGNGEVEEKTGPQKRPTDGPGDAWGPDADVIGPVGPVGPLSGAHTAAGEEERREWSA
jgi:hypothetical protein